MKFLFVLLLVCGVHTFCNAQKQCFSLDRGWIPCNPSDTLTDKGTGNYYVVVRSERCIKAFDKNKTILWQAYPWRSNELAELLKDNWTAPNSVDSISIDAIDFPRTEYMGGDRSIVVYFNYKIVGAINKKTGRFELRGQN